MGTTCTDSASIDSTPSSINVLLDSSAASDGNLTSSILMVCWRCADGKLETAGGSTMLFYYAPVMMLVFDSVNTSFEQLL